MIATEVKNLQKAFVDLKAVDEVTFEVGQGKSSACSARTGPGKQLQSGCFPVCCAWMRVMPS
jgi:ABC-type branched-subunit amino acid transport system ATPase component